MNIKTESSVGAYEILAQIENFPNNHALLSIWQSKAKELGAATKQMVNVLQSQSTDPYMCMGLLANDYVCIKSEFP